MCQLCVSTVRWCLVLGGKQILSVPAQGFRRRYPDGGTGKVLVSVLKGSCEPQTAHTRRLWTQLDKRGRLASQYMGWGHQKVPNLLIHAQQGVQIGLKMVDQIHVLGQSEHLRGSKAMPIDAARRAESTAVVLSCVWGSTDPKCAQKTLRYRRGRLKEKNSSYIYVCNYICDYIHT